MLLKNLKRLFKIEDESGSTIVPVIILTGVGLLITVIIGNQVIQSFNYTIQAQAKVQAQIAAEAGLLAAKAELDNCTKDMVAQGGTLTSEQPNYDAVFKVVTASDAVGIVGCPYPGPSKIIIQVTGYSSLNASLFDASPYELQMEEFYDYHVTGPIENGPAVFSYQGGLGVQVMQPVVAGDYAPLIVSQPNTDFTCSGTQRIEGDVYVTSGRVVMSNSCRISGDVWASAGIVMSGTTRIFGQASTPAGAVLQTGSYVHDLVTGGAADVRLGASVDNLNAGTASIIAGKVKYLRAYSTVTIRSGAALTTVVLNDSTCTTACKANFTEVTSNNRTITTAIFPNQNVVESKLGIPLNSITWNTSANATSPIDPNPPDWISVQYDPNNWLEAGFSEIVDTPTATVSCNFGSSSAGQSALSTYVAGREESVVLDAFSNGVCGDGGVGGDLNFNLTSDVAIISSKFGVNDLRLSSADGLPHSVWLIVPDGVNGYDSITNTGIEPDCSASGNTSGNRYPIYIDGTVAVDTNLISVLLYTPCDIKISQPGVTLRGQIITRSFNPSHQPLTLIYDTIGIPGFDLGSGAKVTPDKYDYIPRLLYRRDFAQ